MIDRAELMEAALDVYPEGVALLDTEEHVVFWSRAAEIVTGYSGADLLGRRVPDALRPLTLCRDHEMSPDPRNGPRLGRGSLVHAQHKRGHDIPAIARRVILRNGLGSRIGTVAVFHPGEHLNALPHGETSGGAEARQTQAEFEDRLTIEFEAFLHEALPLAVLWVSVDQGHELRRTHGAGACETMLESVERALANGLRPGEEVGRWGDDEFLVLAHESSEDVLARHAQTLAGLTRTADFRWWGDRVSLTASVGCAVARRDETLVQVLERARGAVLASSGSGGNRVTVAPEK